MPADQTQSVSILVASGGCRQHLPNPRNTRKVESDVLDGQGLRQTKNELSAQMGTGRFFLASAKYNIIFIKTVMRQQGG